MASCQLLISCVAFQLPPETIKSDESIKNVKSLTLKVAVIEYKLPIYSRKLAGRLRETNLFMTVDNVKSTDNNYDLYAVIENHHYDDDLSVEAFLIHLFGLIPYTDEAFSTGDDFVLFSNNPWKKIDHLDFKQNLKAIMCLGAPCVALTPDWSLREPEHTKRYLDNMTNALSITISRNYQR